MTALSLNSMQSDLQVGEVLYKEGIVFRKSVSSVLNFIIIFCGNSVAVKEQACSSNSRRLSNTVQLFPVWTCQ